MTDTLFRMGRAGIVPRGYQAEAHDETVRLFDDHVGVLIRSATGTGKTIMASLVIDTWLRRSEQHRVMVVSYEQQLVWQFAEEVHDFTGIAPGIEMEKERAGQDSVIVVASRQSLLTAPAPTSDQVERLAAAGVTNLGAAPRRAAESCLRRLAMGADPREISEWLARLNQRPEAADGKWSRLHQFDPTQHWLVIFDEAHRHAYHLASVQPIVDWFERNPLHRRLGLTATPKRYDGVSLGNKMFPAIALDYPLYASASRCALNDGYAVRYVQKYVEVEGVDFRAPHLLDATSESGFDDEKLAMALEERLASFVLPTLDLVESRRTLVFSPRVEMARQVAAFINARRLCVCPQCGQRQWHPRVSLARGECVCKCGRDLTVDNIACDADMARALDGTSPVELRKQTYQQFRECRFQFLSVCGLCREGFNNPDVAAIACFRPVSRKASALAEQMKGRACRVHSSLAGRMHELASAEERLAAIADSPKPNALIVDLVGITGLGDCASTVQIYAEGKPDVIVARAEQLLTSGDVMDIEDALARAEEEEEAKRRRAAEERQRAEASAKEEAERRARAQADVRYSTHEVGFGDGDPDIATEKQYKFMRFLGLAVHRVISRGQAGRIINQLKQRLPIEEIAAKNHLGEGQWSIAEPSAAQVGFARWKKIDLSRACSGYDVSLLIDSTCNPKQAYDKLAASIRGCRRLSDLDGPRSDLALVRGILPDEMFAELCHLGRTQRQALEKPDELPD